MYGPVLVEELLMEILSWVPVKALMRFRCVSKSWKSLIFDPMFIKLHLQRSSKNSHILLTFRAFTEESDEEDFKDKEDLCLASCSIRRLLESPSSTMDDAFWHQFNEESIVDVCNGLVCLLDTWHGYAYQQHCFRVWNPATRFMSQDSPFIRVTSYDVRYMFGFGYDDLSDTYKVVAFLLDVKSQIWEVKIHCLDDPCWRNISTFSTFPSLIPMPMGYIGNFVIGTVNWLVLRGSSSDYQWGERFSINWLLIFSYDLRTQTCKYLLPPDNLGDADGALHPFDVELGVLRGCLCLSNNHKGTNFVVWVMKEFGVEKSWTRLLNICHEHLNFKPMSQKPLYISESGDVVMLVNTHNMEVVLYNRRDNKINRTKEPYGSGFYSYDHCQSLVLPHGKSLQSK